MARRRSLVHSGFANEPYLQLRATRYMAPSSVDEEIRVALMREDVLDRRWIRRRDQLLTGAALVGVGLGALLGSPELASAGLLPAAPRVTHWLLEARASSVMRPDSPREHSGPKRSTTGTNPRYD